MSYAAYLFFFREARRRPDSRQTRPPPAPVYPPARKGVGGPKGAAAPGDPAGANSLGTLSKAAAPTPTPLSTGNSLLATYTQASEELEVPKDFVGLL